MLDFDSLPIQLYNHQKEGVKRTLQHPNKSHILAFQVGTGKTYTALTIAKFLEDKCIPTKIIIPPSLRTNWEREISKVGNYDIELYSWTKMPKSFDGRYFLITDESHLYSNITSSRCENYLNLALPDNYMDVYGVLCLTGTPLPNGQPKNLYPLLKSIRHPVAANKDYYEKRYCLPCDAPILMSDLTEKPVSEICVGDEIIGWIRGSTNRICLSKSVVTDCIKTQSSLIKVHLKNGDFVICTPDHFWFSDRASKLSEHVVFENNMYYRIPKIGGTLACIFKQKNHKAEITDNYRLGYINGVFRGDGWCTKKTASIDNLFETSKFKSGIMGHRVGIACLDYPIIERVKDYLDYFQVKYTYNLRKDKLHQLLLGNETGYNFIKSTEFSQDNYDWYRGFLSGMYDAEGSKNIFSQYRKINPTSHELLIKAFNFLGYSYTESKDLTYIRLLGGRDAFFNFWIECRPACKRKLIRLLELDGGKCMSEKSEIIKIEDIQGIHDVYTLTTSTGNYVAYGYASKNCNAHLVDFISPNTGKRVKYWDNTGSSNLKELWERTKDSIYYVRQSDCLDLPEHNRIFKEIDFSKEEQKIYKEKLDVLKADYYARLDAGDIKSGAEHMVFLGYARKIGCELKIPYTEELINQILAEKNKPIVFCSFLEPLETLAEKYNADIISGKITDKQKLVDKFNNSEKNVLFIQTQTAVGFNIQAGNYGIFIDRTYSPKDYEQAEGRYNRHGQLSTTTSIWLQNGIDMYIDEILLKKTEIINLVLTGKRKTLSGIKSIEDIAPELLREIFDY